MKSYHLHVLLQPGSHLLKSRNLETLSSIVLKFEM